MQAGESKVFAGVQIRLDPGWKTYWRTPGDSGVPPSFDWSGSKNLKEAQVLYPAPRRFADASGTAIGYEDEVVFPIKITPERPDEPVELKLNVDYGLCKTLCIPNEASLSIELPPQMAAGQGDDLLLSASSISCRSLPSRTSCRRLAASRRSSMARSQSSSSTRHFPDGATGTDLFIEAPGGASFPCRSLSARSKAASSASW